MIIERRVYTLRPGRTADFWQAQQDWNLGETFAGVLTRNLAYFETVAGPAEQIVHLYRFDSMEEWDRAYAAVYAHHPHEYFQIARPLILSQDVAFYRVAPVSALAIGDAGAIRPPEINGDIADTVVTETTMQLLPGGLPTYWAAYEQYCKDDYELSRFNLIGTYVVFVGGPLHVVREYRWFEGVDAWQRFASQSAESAARHRFVDSYRDLVTAFRTVYMKPAPLPSYRSLFESVGD